MGFSLILFTLREGAGDGSEFGQAIRVCHNNGLFGEQVSEDTIVERLELGEV